MNFKCRRCGAAMASVDEFCDGCQALVWAVQWAPRTDDFIVFMWVLFYGPVEPGKIPDEELLATWNYQIVGVREINEDGTEQPMRDVTMDELPELDELIHWWLAERPDRVTQLKHRSQLIENFIV